MVDTRISRWFSAPLLVGALALTACGSDDEADATPAEQASGDATSEDDAATEAAETDAPPAAAGGGDFCVALETYVDDVNPDPMADVAELELLASIAPSEIADDMERLAGMTAQMYDFDEITASQDEIAEFETLIEEFEPVSDRLDAWTIENCPDLVID
jgi:hypothetical protein